MDVRYQVNPLVDNKALNALFAAAWPEHRETDFATILTHSLCTIGAFADGEWIGFVKVAWDGGVHGFILDTTVHPQAQRHGIGVELVKQAAEAAKARGIEWLHVDYEPHLDDFYRACGFRYTAAGLMNLK